MVRIITDSACDLPKAVVDELNIEVMPLIVYLNDEEHYEGDMDPKVFYDEMRKGAKTRTAQVAAPVFEKTFEKYAKAKEEVLYIAFSSGLSGTYQTSELVKSDLMKKYPDFNLHIIDSKAASIGFGLIVYYAALMARADKSMDEILAATNFNAEHMEHVFTVDDLEYLYRGGRVSRGAAVIGSMLNIKPILDVEDGKLIPLQKIRTRKKAMARMVEMVGERGTDLQNQVIGINHGDDLKAAEQLRDMITEKYGTKDFILNYVGCVIGAHSGPGTLSVFFLNDTKKAHK